MTVYDLNRDQLQELKQRYYAEKTGEDLSYDEIYRIDDLVSDEEVYDEYSGTDFVPDDFFCSEGQDEDDFVSFRLGIDASGSKYDIASDLRQIADDIEGGYYGGLANYGTSWGLDRD